MGNLEGSFRRVITYKEKTNSDLIPEDAGVLSPGTWPILKYDLINIDPGSYCRWAVDCWRPDLKIISPITPDRETTIGYWENLKSKLPEEAQVYLGISPYHRLSQVPAAARFIALTVGGMASSKAFRPWIRAAKRRFKKSLLHGMACNSLGILNSLLLDSFDYTNLRSFRYNYLMVTNRAGKMMRIDLNDMAGWLDFSPDLEQLYGVRAVDVLFWGNEDLYLEINKKALQLYGELNGIEVYLS